VGSRGKQFKLTRENTLWVFVVCSHEQRHLEDVIFAVDALRKRGIDDAHWMIFSDHPRLAQHLGPFGMDGSAFQVDELAKRLSSAEPHEHVVLVVGGHGHVTGLGAPPRPPESPILPPFELCSATRSVPGLVCGVIVLSQCYGGVFNFSDAQTEPSLVMLGASNLNPSLSLTTNLVDPIKQRDGTPGLIRWGANAFLLDMFLWVRSPTDVDGDGRLTVMDAFKFAGANSNGRLRGAKLGGFVEAQEKSRRLTTVQEELKAAAGSGDAMAILEKRMALNAIVTELQAIVEILYTTNEPWLLNAYLAVDLIFDV